MDNSTGYRMDWICFFFPLEFWAHSSLFSSSLYYSRGMALLICSYFDITFSFTLETSIHPWCSEMLSWCGLYPLYCHSMSSFNLETQVFWYKELFINYLLEEYLPFSIFCFLFLEFNLFSSLFFTFRIFFKCLWIFSCLLRFDSITKKLIRALCAYVGFFWWSSL